MAVNVAGRPVSVGPRAAWRAVRAEIASQSRWLRLWLASLIALMLFGLYGAIASIVPGKQVFGTTPVVEWGLLIAAYVFFATTTSGLCLASSLGTVFGIERFMPLERRHAILALLCLITAFGVIALDLHYPIRLAFGAVLSPSPYSPMWWMGVLYGVYLGFLGVEVWSMFRGHDRVHRVACLLSSCMAIAAPSTLGAVFGVMATRPFWHGAFAPVTFLAFALLAGLSVLGIVFYAVHRFDLRGARDAREAAIPAIRLLLTIVLSVSVFLTIWQAIIGFYGGVPGLSEATRALVTGPLAPTFWIFKVGLGTVVPLVLLTLPRTRTPGGLFAASCLALLGAFADRFGFVIAGQLTPDTAASGIVSEPYAVYTPTIVEISVVVGAVALIAFFYTLSERFLDLGHIDAHGHRPAGSGAPLVLAAAAAGVPDGMDATVVAAGTGVEPRPNAESRRAAERSGSPDPSAAAAAHQAAAAHPVAAPSDDPSAADATHPVAAPSDDPSPAATAHPAAGSAPIEAGADAAPGSAD